MDKCNVQSRHFRFYLRRHVICNAQGPCAPEWKGADAPQKPKYDRRCRYVPNVSVVHDDFLAITEFKLIWWHQIHRILGEIPGDSINWMREKHEMQFPLTPFRPLPGTTSLILTPGPTIQSYDGFGNGHCTLVEIMHRDAPWLVLCGFPVFYFLHFIDHVVASSSVSLSFTGTKRVSFILFLFHEFFPYLHSGRVHVVICCHMLSSVLNLGSSRRFESGAHPKWRDQGHTALRDKGDTCTSHHTNTGHPAAPEILRFELFDRSASKAWKVRQESKTSTKCETWHRLQEQKRRAVQLHMVEGTIFIKVLWHWSGWSFAPLCNVHCMIFSQADFWCGRCCCLWILKGHLMRFVLRSSLSQALRFCSFGNAFDAFDAYSLGGPHQLCRSQRRLGWAPASFQFHDMHEISWEISYEISCTKKGKSEKLAMNAGEREPCMPKAFTAMHFTRGWAKSFDQSKHNMPRPQAWYYMQYLCCTADADEIAKSRKVGWNKR